MVFWRRNKNQKDQDREKQDEKLLHRKSDPAIEPPTEYDSDIDPDLKHELQESENEIIEDLDELPVPDHTEADDQKEAEELDDHSEEGGWFSRLTFGLSKSTSKITRGITDVLTKSKLDDETLERLEEVLIEADLGPKTASKIIESFSSTRFGKDIDENEIRAALSEEITNILGASARPLSIPESHKGPFVILVCGVNGAGKTTTIGKMAHQFKKGRGKKVMIAAGDTFRAAAIEQLDEWAKRSGASFVAKDIGADAAAVAFEAYEQAVAEGVDILMIDTAGRLQNKTNLMAELEKILRVLKKKDESLPHATMLVLDSTTGQNAFSQVQTFKDMVDVTGLVVTKLDGSAKGGVLVGLADQFGLPVYAIGVGESIEDLQPFKAEDYAAALLGQ